MNAQLIYQIIGYFASVLIAISMMMKSVLRLRVINGIGGLVFVIYGILIKAYPVAILNTLVVIIDAYYFLKMLKRSDFFTVMDVAPDSTYFTFFINFNKKDIRTFFPEFNYKSKPGDLIFFILRNTIPAGLVIVRPEGHTGRVLLDYALKDYRDFKIGAFIFDDNSDILLDRGITDLVTKADVTVHAKYLRQMNFKQSDDGQFRRKLYPHFIKDQEI